MTESLQSPDELEENLLADYLAGELSPGERTRIEHWITSDIERAEYVQRLRRKWERVGTSSIGPVDVQQAWQTVAAQVVPKLVPPSGPLGDSSRSFQREGSGTVLPEKSERRVHYAGLRAGVLASLQRAKYVVGGAAAIALVLFLGGRLTAYQMNGDLASRSSIYTTPNGQRANVTLPDGSAVVLNVGSRLEVPANFAAGNRTVRLIGEAMFTVLHRDASPFVVQAGPSQTRVLGTRFLVRHYPTDSTAMILVQDGKVAVGNTILSASQQVTVTTHGVLSLQAADIKQFGFVNGVLTLSSRALLAAIPDLNRWYDAEIQLGDPALASQRIAGGFRAGSLTDLISILELTYDVRVVRDGRVLTLYPKN